MALTYFPAPRLLADPTTDEQAARKGYVDTAIDTAVSEAVDGLDAGDVGAAPAVHTHAGEDVDSGEIDYDRLPVGTSAGTVAAGDDTRITGAVPSTRQITAGTGLTGGGALSADRSLAVAYGSAASTAVQGNDARVTADQAAGTASIRTLGTGALQAAAGNDSRLSDARTPTAHNHAASNVNSGTLDAARLPLVPNPPVAITYNASLTPVASDGNYRVCTATGNLTLNEPTSPADGQMWRIRIIASGAQRTVTLNAGRLPSHIDEELIVPSGDRCDIGLLYETGDGWTVLAAQVA